MNKGIFSIPVYNQKTSMNKMLNEVIDQVIKADEWGLKEAFFGEHITDKHEKITSSLMMVATLAKLTKKKLNSLKLLCFVAEGDSSNLIWLFSFVKRMVLSPLLSNESIAVKGARSEHAPYDFESIPLPAQVPLV